MRMLAQQSSPSLDISIFKWSLQSICIRPFSLSEQFHYQKHSFVIIEGTICDMELLHLSPLHSFAFPQNISTVLQLHRAFVLHVRLTQV